jgi:hypothetical protein
MSGFEFHETMAGSYRLGDDSPADRPMSFTIRARSGSLWAFLRKPEVAIEGEVDAEGFADHRHLRGTLGMDAVRTGALPYAFEFTANDGRRYVFEGKKTLSATRLAESMTVLPGAIKDDRGAEVGRALLRFDLRSDLLKFLRSFKPAT